MPRSDRAPPPTLSDVQRLLAAFDAEVHPGEALRFLRFRDREYRLQPIARWGASPVLLCESPLHSSIPAAAERRELWAAAGGPALMIYSDAGHSAFVWSIHAHPGEAAQREADFRVPGQMEALRGMLTELARPPSFPPRLDRDAGSAVLHACLGVARLPGGFASHPLSADVRRALDGIREPGEIRRAWHRADDLRVLDPCLEDGSWILGAGVALEILMIALLDRMRSVLADRSAEGDGGPRDFAAFGRILARFEYDAARDSMRRRVRGQVVSRHLHAVVPSGGLVRAVRRQLMEYAGLAASQAWSVAANIRSRRMIDACESAGPGCRPALPPDIQEEIEMLGFTRATLQGMVTAPSPAHEGAAAYREIQRRTRTLRRRLRREGIPLDPHLELSLLFPAPGPSAGFDVVRGAM